EYDAKTVKKRWNENTPGQLTEIVIVFETVNNWQADTIKEVFSAFMNEKEWGFGAIMNPLRLALVGGNMGPDLFVICELLGKEESIARIKTAIEKI
ncbi:MAG TPA: glutamate--tRNA ligase, partial [Draconibacterium sp.]|nr:glutamate--tRNA ligase [Draconibacterium sp.]